MSTPNEAAGQSEDTKAEQPDGATQSSEGEAVDYEKEAAKWKALSRQNEARARENADKAKRFDELTEAAKTETQKALDRAEAAEKLAAEKAAELARVNAAREHKLTDEDMKILAVVPADQVEEIAAALAARHSAGTGGLADRLGNLGDKVPAKGTTEKQSINDLLRAAHKH